MESLAGWDADSYLIRRRSACHYTRCLPLHCRHRLARGETTDRDFEAGDGFLAAHRRRGPGSYGAQEGENLRTQRLGVAYGQMSHGIAAIRLKAEALGYLASEHIRHDVFAACSNDNRTRFERRQPVGVDVSQHARCRTKLQQRDVL